MTIVNELDRLMQGFSHTRKDLGYGYRWIFDNGMWFDLIDYKKKWKNIFRVWRGAWLVKQSPLLYDRFDEVSKVIAKVELKDLAIVDQKHMIGICTLLHQAPSGIGVYDV